MESWRDIKEYKVFLISNGDSLPEYALLLCFISIITIMVLLLLGSAVANVFEGVIQGLQ